MNLWSMKTEHDSPVRAFTDPCVIFPPSPLGHFTDAPEEEVSIGELPSTDEICDTRRIPLATYCISMRYLERCEIQRLHKVRQRSCNRFVQPLKLKDP
jgi:hypothetical protein